MMRVGSSRFNFSVSSISKLRASPTRICQRIYEAEDAVPKSNCGVPLTTALHLVHFQSFHSSSPSGGWFSPKDDLTFMGRTLQRLGFTSIPKSILNQSGALMYMKVIDDIDYMKFFKYCDLPDTYASWFIVMELHVWLLCARAMQLDGNEGKIVRNAIIHAMWDDNDLKSKKLEGAISSGRKKELKLLHSQFNAAVFGYDEGLLGDDYILAGALWRRILKTEVDQTVDFKSKKLDDVTHERLLRSVKALEMLVIYVRTQYYMLSGLSKEQLLRKRAIKFVPFDESLYDLVDKMEKAVVSPSYSAEAHKIRR